MKEQNPNTPPPHPGPPVVRDVLRQAVARLKGAGAPSAALDGELLLAHVLQAQRIDLILRPDRVLTGGEHDAFEALVERRLRHEPVAYLLGWRDFFGRSFHVDGRVLIPRPETELLVEKALERLVAARHRRPALVVLDLGTGSGAIAVTLAAEAPDAQVVASDISADALAVARQNACRHGVEERIEWVRADGLDALAGPFDLIVSNPPYIRDDARATLMADVRDWEPPLALFAGPEGLDVIARLAPAAAERLWPSGALLMEIGYDQGEAVQAMLRGDGRWQGVEAFRDGGGHERVVCAWV